MYTVYECSILHDGQVEKVNANWAGVIHKIYDALGEEKVKMLTSNLQETQAEMFFGQWVNVEMGCPGYKIKIKSVESRDET